MHVKMQHKENRFLYDPVGNALAVCAEIIKGFVIALALPQQSEFNVIFATCKRRLDPTG